MSCASCGRTNPAIARFCAGCGTPLAPRCLACGAENEGDARFCIACGASLAARPAAETAEVRKVVTIVFADLIGSTALHERLDPESVSRVMERYHRAVRVPVEAHGGTVVQLLGDGVMCAFGVPHVAEDDAIRAVRAAVGIQQAFRAFARAHAELVGSVGLRVAVNTGEVVVSDDYAAGIGDPLNVAARLQQEARDGDVLIGESTERLVRALVTLEPFGVLALKGRSETVTAYRVVSLERPAGVSATPFVGRDGELRRLIAVYDAAVATPAARLAVILGSPGLGKSRLLDELARRLAGATVLTCSCEAAGGATFAPIARALRTHLRSDDGTAGGELRAAIQTAVAGAEVEHARIIDGIAALLAGTPASPEETFFVIRRFLAALATAQPVVLAIDDLQWAEPLLLDLVEHLTQWSTGVPLLLLVAARPELRDVRSSLATPGALVAEVVTLAGLDAGAATRLAANVIGADELPAAVAGRVLATSEGNPLFVGELVRMLVHDGALKREGERWTTGVELAALEMPPTIQALLAARIERLKPEERTVLERAAVVGRQFSRAAVTHLLPREITDLDARLEALRRSELIEPDAGWFLGEPALRFHHVLIRDAAYRRLLKGTRAELHARFAEWLAARAGDSVEHDETLGWHLEQAHQHLRELGPLDEKGKRLGERASTHLAAAGRRALGRDDLPLAASLLGRAIERLDLQDTARAELALDWCEALLAAGDVAAAAKAIDELDRWSSDERRATSDERPESSSRLRAWHTCFAGQLAVLTDPQALHGTAAAVAAAADALAAAGDGAGEAKAHLVHALALSRLGRIGACEAELDKALAAARRVDDRRRSNTVLANAPLAALWGPSPVTRASGRCLDVVRVLRITQGAPAVEAVALRCQAVLEALRGRGDAARRMIASSRRMVEELGITQGVLETEMFAGLIGLIEGDTAAAEHSLRAAYEGFRDHGLGIDAARAGALLGRTLLADGRAAEAEALSHESEALAGDDLQAAITWRRVRAEALARRGEHAPAVGLARAAVDIAAATDALLHHADARLGLAVALRAAGRSGEAAAEQARAVELWEAKGATLLAERARRTAPPIAPIDGLSVPRDQPEQSVRRRVQPNAATAAVARVNAAFAARDGDALARLSVDLVDHTAHLAFDRRDVLSAWESLFRADDLTYYLEPLASLGDSLALCRRSVSASGVGRGEFDVGAYEAQNFLLIEVGARGGRGRAELFAADRLGDAIVRLYERYAEGLPEGPAHELAAATAHSIAVSLGPFDPEHYATAYAPAIEKVDHRPLATHSARGADAVTEHLRVWLELADELVAVTDDILGLTPRALLVRRTFSGTDRRGGGAFERPFLMLLLIDAAGWVARSDHFDVDREAEALARFDELALSGAYPEQGRRVEGLTAEPPALFPGRRVQANAATAQVARLDAAIAGRNEDAFPMLFAEDAEVVDHTTGATYGRSGTLDHFRRQRRIQDLAYRQEPLATLGDSLALCRLSVSGSGAAGRTWDVGAFEFDNFQLVEVDAQGRRRRLELFAADRLGDAVARLYERHAELLPDGPERTRAIATARSVAPVRERFDPDRYAAVFASDIAAVDHRATIGWGRVRGAEALREVLRTQLEVADDIAIRVDDIIALRSDAFLVRWTNFGKARVGGGEYERHFLILWAFGPDGFATHIELFDADRDAEALARFDELASPARHSTAHPEEPPPLRRRLEGRVPANAATATLGRVDALIAARDIDAVLALYADDVAGVDHRNHVEIDRSVIAQVYRSYLAAKDLRIAFEPLATLGDSLVLFRQTLSSSGTTRGSYDVGAYDREEVFLIEVDAAGRRRWIEVFPTDRLGDAVARLYARYAEQLPEGAARDRAAATAGSVAALLGEPELDRWASAFSPTIEWLDRRMVGAGRIVGADAVRRTVGAFLELTDRFSVRFDDVLALRSDGYVILFTTFGTDRSGGSFERRLCQLELFGSDGLLAYWEQWDAEQGSEALARFDEFVLSPARPEPVLSGACPEQGRRVEGPGRTVERVVAESPAAPPARRRLKPNAATAHAARLSAAIAARDAAALRTLIIADEAEVVHHPTHVVYDVREHLRVWQAMIESRDGALVFEPLATLGDSLALARQTISASRAAGKTFDVGPYEIDLTTLLEVDEQGRRRRSEHFAPDRLGDAAIRLYERYAELLPPGPERTRAAATARSVALMHGSWEVDHTRLFAPAVEVVDHRIMGTWSARGAKATVEHFRSVLELADNVASRFDDVLGLRPDAFLVRGTHSGTIRAGGGVYERPFLLLSLFAPDGLVARQEYFDPDRDADALARFDELVSAAPARRFENAATRVADRLREAMEARDWERFTTLFAAGFRSIDRQRMAQLEADRDRYLDAWRPIFETFTSSTITSDLLATRGERLLLARILWTGSGHSIGSREYEWLEIFQVDDNGQIVTEVTFDPDDLDAAYGELDERYVAGEATPLVAMWFETLQQQLRSPARDWDKVAAALAPDFVVEDHSPLGWGRLDRAAYFESVKALAALAPDSRIRTDHLWLCERGALGVHLVLGTHEGGAFEQPRVTVSELDAQGRERRRDVYTLDQLDEARARFAAVSARSDAVARDPLAALTKPNAATAARDRLEAAFAARDWAAVRALCVTDVTFEDRRRYTLVSMDIEGWIADRQRWARSGVQQERRLVATAGDRIALERVSTISGPPGGRSEFEYLLLSEVDENGRILATVAFDPDDWRAAQREALARVMARDPEAAASVKPVVELIEAFNDRDLARGRAVVADDYVTDDHRRTGVGRREGASSWGDGASALWNLAPDVQFYAVHMLACDRHGFVGSGRLFGTFTEGGGAFEIHTINVFAVEHGRITRYEVFEPEDVDAALARFEELRPLSASDPRRTDLDPLRIPPNAATRASDRVHECVETGAWEALRALCAPILFEDRRRLIRTTGGCEMAVANGQVIAEAGGRYSRTVLATAGDRLVLEHLLVAGPRRATFEVEALRLLEVDADGRLLAAIIFDPDDRRAAALEILERYARSDAARGVPAAAFDALCAVNAHDLERVGATLRDDFVLNDHRRAGLGRLEKADYLASLAALFEQAPDVGVETLYIVAVEAHGVLMVARNFGTLREGGEFESPYVRIMLHRGERLAAVEMFEVEELDAARARFEELRG
jgi:class 3 adenylate cyclase